MERTFRWLVGWLLAATILAACASPPELPPTAAPSPTTSPAPAPPATPMPTAVPTAPVATATSETGETPATGGLLVNLTTDDTWSANMALSLATRAREEGLDPVIVFLNVRGVYLGDRERLPATEGNSDLNIHEKLQAFVDAGGQVIACPSCSREAGLTQDDYIEGVHLGEPGGILQFLSDPAITVMSYSGRSGRK